jgi:hypothetical protein
VVSQTDTTTDTGFRCSPWTRAQGVDPIGSAGQLDQLLLVEWPLPWPADVADIPELADIAADARARLMAVVPRADDAEGDGQVRVVHHRRVGTHRLTGIDHRVDRAAVPGLLHDLLDAPPGDHLDWTSAIGEAPPEVLVCGHGRRDPCCGRWGTLLHVELAARRTDIRVWRCSHTGGHRFAPTAITLPDGRAWAYADVDLIERVLARQGDVAALAPHDRGGLAFDPWAQVVDRELFVRRGWSWLDHEIIECRTWTADDGRRAIVRLRWRRPAGQEEIAQAEVAVARILPVLVCGEPPEAARKSSPEYQLVHLEVG